MNNKTRKRTRFALRLTPMTLMGRASTEGLEQVALKVLAPHFHQEPFRARTVCILCARSPGLSQGDDGLQISVFEMGG